MRTGSYVDALDESFEYMVSSPTPQYILDYCATETEKNRSVQTVPTEAPAAPPPEVSENLINRFARSLFTLFKRPQ